MRAETSELLKDLERIRDTDNLLRKLYNHHASQAKPITEPVSDKYNQQLADEIKSLLDS